MSSLKIAQVRGYEDGHVNFHPTAMQLWSLLMSLPRPSQTERTYLHMQVQLGGLEPDGALQEAQELLEGDMRRPKHSWQAPFAEGRCADMHVDLCYVQGCPSLHLLKKKKKRRTMFVRLQAGDQHGLYRQAIYGLALLRMPAFSFTRPAASILSSEIQPCQVRNNHLSASFQGRAFCLRMYLNLLCEQQT